MTEQPDQESKNQFDPIFPRLVKGDGAAEKLLGFIAYGLYQDAKQEWLSDFREREKRNPLKEELYAYERSWTTSRLEALENAAAQLVTAYRLCGNPSREADSSQRFEGALLERRMELDGRCAALHSVVVRVCRRFSQVRRGPDEYTRKAHQSPLTSFSEKSF